MQAEDFALAHAGADEDFEQVGQEWVGLVAVAQEAGGFVGGPDAPLG
ncbi:hypothetical protein [Kitasatospora sp. NPDC090308]